MKASEIDDYIYENASKSTINDLPDELIEFVLSFVPPYNDLHNCMIVSKRWKKCVQNVVRIKRRQLLKALSDFNVHWQRPEFEILPTIAKRYSHASVVHENSMYVFGGCTNSMTTFNDLWCLDLSTRKWIRPVATGVYPTPKACCSFVCHKNTLILFGGWAYPCSYPFHQSYQLFNELHTYDILHNRWNHILPLADIQPPPIAGHSVSIHGNRMIVFGGMQRADPSGPLVKTNSVWCLELDTLIWKLVETTSPKPKERYGQSQTALDENHALIMGGCGGPNGIYHDVWLLNMSEKLWSWTQVEVRNQSNAPVDTWCHPTCLVGNHIVVLNKSQTDVPSKSCWRPPGPDTQYRHPPIQINHRRTPPEPIRVHRTVPERPNIIVHHKPRESRLSLSAFNTEPVRNNVLSRNQAELHQRMAEALRQKCIKNEKAQNFTPKVAKKRNKLNLFLLDITGALTSPNPYVTWLKSSSTSFSGPEETLLYTLVYGKAELIMFGGIQKDNINYMDTNCFYNTKVSNNLYILTAPIDII